jgi:GH43 family beta-xylosidase
VTDHAAEDPLAWTNPLVAQRADPHVTLHTDGFYYLTASVPEYDRIEVRRARTLAGLGAAEPSVVWRRHETGPMGAHVWAPELHRIGDRWYLYFAAGDVEDVWHIRPYVLESAADDPREPGAWAERGRIHTAWDAFSLDATTFAHRGRRYLCWAQNLLDGPGTSLCLAEMETPWSLAEGPQAVISRPEFDWERVGHRVNEGPAVLIRNGRVFLTYSASATDAHYCMGLLTANEDADLLDPASWAKSPEPVFRSSRETGQFGPGHNCFTTTPDGATDLIVYHARPYEEIDGEPLYNPDRATRAQAVGWRPDGTPDFGAPVADGAYRTPA